MPVSDGGGCGGVITRADEELETEENVDELDEDEDEEEDEEEDDEEDDEEEDGKVESEGKKECIGTKEMDKSVLVFLKQGARPTTIGPCASIDDDDTLPSGIHFLQITHTNT